MRDISQKATLALAIAAVLAAGAIYTAPMAWGTADKVRELEASYRALQDYTDALEACVVEQARITDYIIDALEAITYRPYTPEQARAAMAEITSVLDKANPRLTKAQKCEIASAIFYSAAEAGIDPALILAIMRVESQCQPDARGAAGEYGLMQLLPGTGEWLAARLGIAPTLSQLMAPATNIKLGTLYLADQVLAFGDLGQAVLAYNRGPGGARTWLKTRPAEVNSYVKAVLAARGGRP